MPTDFRVVAILAAYNEADIIEQVVADLIAQGVDVYLLDDGSTDGGVSAVERFVGRGVLRIERLAEAGAAPSREFDWESILRRKAAIARELDADWCIHHDADEFRESPWPGVTLRDAVQRVDAAGFNAIDFASLDFWPIHDRLQPGDDVRAAFTHYAARAPYDRVQVRAWKNTGVDVDLASSGGHDAQFPGRRVFPLRFIARHYPIRSQAHGARKVFHERVGRFRADERARGWHVQYDDMVEGVSFIRDPSTLTEYDPEAVRLALTLRHRGVEALETALDEARCVAGVQRRRIDELETVSRAQERDLELHRAELERCAAYVASVEAEADRRGRHGAALEAELTRTTAELAATRAELERCAAYVASVEAEIDRRGRHRSALEAELARAAGIIAERETALADRTSAVNLMSTRLTAAESENAERAREIAAARDFVAHQARAIESLERAVADAGRRIDTVHRSLSWRLTAPARAVLRALRGR